MCGEPTDDVWSPIVFVSHMLYSLFLLYGIHRFVLQRHWQLLVNCLKRGISKALFRAAVMNPKLEMSVVEQRLFSISFSLSLSVRAAFLITLQLSCHPHYTPIQTANSHGPLSLFILWCIPLECIPWVQGRLVTEPPTPPSLSALWWIHRSKTATSSDINFLSNMTSL